MIYLWQFILSNTETKNQNIHKIKPAPFLIGSRLCALSVWLILYFQFTMVKADNSFRFAPMAVQREIFEYSIIVDSDSRFPIALWTDKPVYVLILICWFHKGNTSPILYKIKRE